MSERVGKFGAVVARAVFSVGIVRKVGRRL